MSMIAVGGLGADSHAVGVQILARALRRAGFQVVDLGIQNALERFFSAGDFCDAVLMSCMDGHAPYYFDRLTVLPDSCLWYIGGNPLISGNTAPLDHLGFRRIFLHYVPAAEVVDALRADLPKTGKSKLGKLTPRPQESVDNATRTEVLAQWPTGKDAEDFERNVEVLRTRPLLARAQADTTRPLLHPRSGVAVTDAQIALFQDLKSGGADVVSFQVDSLTRSNRYRDVEAVAHRANDLNGYPVVNRGVADLRRVTASVKLPFQTRHSSKDPRLLAEVSYAGGVTAFEGGAICYNVPYYVNLPLETSLARWQYVDELSARYTDAGIKVDREFFGTLTATLVPPVIPIVTNVLEALLAVQAGVHSVSLAYAEQGCRYQDIAAMRAMRALATAVFSDRPEVQVSVVFHQYMADFPSDMHAAELLISASAKTAELAGVQRIVTKTPCEAQFIPDASANLHGLALAHAAMDSTATCDPKLIDEEMDRILRAAGHLLNSVLELARGDIPGAIIAAFQRGILDVPFSPSTLNAAQLVALRDRTGAIRIAHAGNVALPEDILLLERECLRERLMCRGLDFDDCDALVAEDVVLNKTSAFTWPLDDHMLLKDAKSGS